MNIKPLLSRVNNKMFVLIMILKSKTKSLACFLDISTSNEPARGVKYNQQVWAGAGPRFLTFA